MKRLRNLKIGDDCFGSVDEVKLIGLKDLKRVKIGEKSFTKVKNGEGKNLNRHFLLKDCELLKELKIGRYSFCDYTICKIENVDSLEVIQMGNLEPKQFCGSFCYASLELKSFSFHTTS